MPQTYSLRSARLLPQQAGALLLMQGCRPRTNVALNQRAQHHSGTGLDQSLVPPGGFENSPRGKIGDAGVDGPNPALNTRRARHRSGTGLVCSLVPPGGFEPSTPALGGHGHLPYLGKCNFALLYIFAGRLAIFEFLLVLIRILFHPFFTPSSYGNDLQG